MDTVDAAPPVSALLDLSGRVAVVTGAAGGIGAGIAARLAEAGAAVVIHHRSGAGEAEALRERITAAGGRAITHRAELTIPTEVAALFEVAEGAFGLVDVLVSNAGVQPVQPLLEQTPTDWRAMLDGNLQTVLSCTQEAARRMIAAGFGGAVVNIASIEGLQPAAGHSHYAATKAGVIMHTRAAALELGAHGIRVNSVSPGLIWREGLDEGWPEGVARWQASAPLGRLGRAADVADACLFLCSDAARWITGTNLVVDGGVLANSTW